MRLTTYINICCAFQAIWLSADGLPQFFVVDISKLVERPKFFKCVGFDWWHDYQSNPSSIEMSVSTDNQNYITWTVFHTELKPGLQLFNIDPLGVRYQYIKVVLVRFSL